MTTAVTITIETDDMELAGRLGRMLNGTPASVPDPEPDTTDGTEEGQAAETMSPETHAQYERETDHAEPDPAATFGADTDGGGYAPEPPAAAAPAGVDVDSDGLPWDSRIHSSSKKTLSKTGQWKPRRRPKEYTEEQWQQYVDNVQNELRRAMNASGPAPEPEPAPAPAAAAAPPPPPASEPEPAPAASAPQIETFPDLMRAVAERGVSDDKLNNVLRSYGIDHVGLLGPRPDLVPKVADDLFGG